MKRTLSVLILIAVILLLNISSGYAFEFKGFADVSFTKGTEGAEYRNGDFVFGELDLYFAQTIENIDILMELVIEDGVKVDMERLTIGYTFNDALKVRMGRIHTPLGFWNTTYHHGVQLQSTILRPDFLKFEHDGGILPTHIVGLYISGRAQTAVGAIEYGTVVANGPRVTGSEEGDANVLFPNNIEDNNNGKAVALHAAISPDAVPGLKVGLSGHVARVQNDEDAIIDVDHPAVDIGQTIIGAAVTYSRENVDLAGEYFSIKDEDNELGGSYTNDGYYGLITYTFKDRWVPYLMYEDMSVDGVDPYIRSLDARDVTKLTLGLRYNINYRSSLKGEFRSVEKDDNDWSEYAVQWALAF